MHENAYELGKPALQKKSILGKSVAKIYILGEIHIDMLINFHKDFRN